MARSASVLVFLATVALGGWFLNGCFGLPPTNGLFTAGDAVDADQLGPDSCTPGATRCSARGMQTCDTDGTRWKETICACGCQTDLAGARCIPPCKPFERRCDGDILVCRANGCGFEIQENCTHGCTDELLCRFCEPNARSCSEKGNVELCSPDGMTRSERESCELGCENGACARCTPGARQCVNGGVQLCDPESGERVFKPCGSGCNPDTLDCYGCTPGQRRCSSDGHVETCRSDGSGWQTTETCPSGCGLGASGLPQCLTSTTFDSVAAGDFHSCAIRRSDQSLWCWGLNLRGALGLGDLEDRPTPTEIGTGWKEVSAGRHLTCAIRTDGSLWCWGFGGFFGRPEDQPVTSPTLISDADWIAIDVGLSHACGIRQGGSLWCFGQSSQGQLGTGAISDAVQLEPQLVGPADASWIQVSAGRSGTCAIRRIQPDANAGQLFCWGHNLTYGLGQSDLDRIDPEPVPVGPVETLWRQVSILVDHGCAIRDDQSLWCWGRNTEGQLGLKSPAQTNAPLLVEKGPWLSIRAGSGFSCGIKASGGTPELGQAWCFGSNSLGQLGDPDLAEMFGFGQVSGNHLFHSLATSSTHVCGVTAANKLACWGHSNYGQTGNGYQPGVPRPSKAVPGGPWLDLFNGPQSLFGQTVDGGIMVWGYNQYGNLGIGSTGNVAAPQPLSGNAWLSIDGGRFHACGVRWDNTLWCWGDNSFGRVGIEGSQSVVPAQVLGSENSKWIEVTVGAYHSCALQSDNTRWCWGKDSSGVFGNGSTTTTEVPKPLQVDPDAKWRTTQTFDGHACGLKTDDTLWCWGENGQGQLGDGTTVKKGSPTPIELGSTWNDVGVGTTHSCAIRNDQSLFCWGDNRYGQLGDGTTTSRTTPTAVGLKGPWLAVSVGVDHSCGLRGDLSLWCWGLNVYGQLGDGTLTDSPNPHQVFAPAGQQWQKVNARLLDDSCALTSSGQLFCWGLNNYDQLSIGSREQRDPFLLDF